MNTQDLKMSNTYANDYFFNYLFTSSMSRPANNENGIYIERIK